MTNLLALWHANPALAITLAASGGAVLGGIVGCYFGMLNHQAYRGCMIGVLVGSVLAELVLFVSGVTAVFLP